MAEDFDSDDLFFADVVARAETMALLSVLGEVARQASYRDPDGLSVEDRFFAQRKAGLAKLFLSLEDGNPALAARLHEKFDAARQALRDDQL